MHSHLLAVACNGFFRTPLQLGEFDFLQGKNLALELRDAQVRCCIGLQGRCFRSSVYSDADLHISGSVEDFLLLLSRREDPDTLFFSRRLQLRGNTELGLHLKNYLDSREPPPALGRLFAFLGDFILGRDAVK